MDRKLCVVANVRYQSPHAKGANQLKGLLRYVQYRDDRDTHLPQHSRPERWTDHGLGSNFQGIASQCEAFKSKHVQAFTWVINPNPNLIAFIPEDQRETFVQELTETTLQAFFEARAMNVPEYSYAIHRRVTTDPHAPGRDNPHAHVILPSTFDSWTDGARLPLYMNQNRRENHIELLHDIAQHQLDSLLQREVGLDWEQQYDRQLAEQERLALSSPLKEPALPDPLSQPPHTFFQDEQDNTWRVWIARQPSMTTQHRVGLLLQPDQSDTPSAEQFIPLAYQLTSQQANHLTQHLLATLQQAPVGGLDKAIGEATRLQAMNSAQRARFFEELTALSLLAQDSPQTKSGPAFELDL